jgi:hypothetical protein
MGNRKGTLPKKTRGKKLPTSVPPRSFARPVRVNVITGADLKFLSEQAGLVISNAMALDEPSAEINDALYETCHTAMSEDGRNFSEVAAWCEVVASRAEGLAALLVSATPGDGWAPWDAIKWLEPGLPGDENFDLHQDLIRLLTVAAPGQGGNQANDQFLSALAQVAPGLRAVAMVAKRAKAQWANQIQRGGKAPDRPRRHLMLRLFKIYTMLYGAPPTVSVRHDAEGYRNHVPRGRSIDWFRGLFALVEPRLPEEAAADPLRLICRKALTKSDALATWITDAAEGEKSKRNPRY